MSLLSYACVKNENQHPHLALLNCGVASFFALARIKMKDGYKSFLRRINIQIPQF
jgi:uncharacterized protein YgiB involved in biofilm formation